MAVLESLPHVVGIDAELSCLSQFFFRTSTFRRLNCLRIEAEEGDVVELDDEALLSQTSLSNLAVRRTLVTPNGLRRFLEQWRDGEIHLRKICLEIEKTQETLTEEQLLVILRGGDETIVEEEARHTFEGVKEKLKLQMEEHAYGSGDVWWWICLSTEALKATDQ